MRKKKAGHSGRGETPECPPSAVRLGSGRLQRLQGGDTQPEWGFYFPLITLDAAPGDLFRAVPEGKNLNIGQGF